MDNTACKWAAIIGIVLACLIVLWILAAIIRCCCLGVACIEAIFCCCNCCSCCGNRRSRDMPKNDSYNPAYPQGGVPPTVVHNHYSSNQPQYGQVTDFPDEPVKSEYNASTFAPGFMNGGYQKLNNSNNMEMGNMPPPGYNTSYAPSYQTEYNPNHSNSYDNTYDHNNHVGSNNAYYNNRY